MLVIFLPQWLEEFPTVGTTEAEAIESVLDQNPELEIVACEPIDLSDIPTANADRDAALGGRLRGPRSVEVHSGRGPNSEGHRRGPPHLRTDGKRPPQHADGRNRRPLHLPLLPCQSQPDPASRPRATSFPPEGKVFTERPECGAKLFRRRGAAWGEWRLTIARDRTSL